MLNLEENIMDFCFGEYIIKQFYSEFNHTQDMFLIKNANIYKTGKNANIFLLDVYQAQNLS